MLAAGLKKVLPKLISEPQAAFIEGRVGRQISDGVLIANEVIHLWKSEGNRGWSLRLILKKHMIVLRRWGVGIPGVNG